MRKSTNLHLIISAIAAALTFSCGYRPGSDFRKTAAPNATYHAAYFSNPEMDYVYKANISAYGHKLTGIFIAKKSNDSLHRVVFTTEFGNKMLDLSVGENKCQVNSIADALNRKMIVKTLCEDFSLLLHKNFDVLEAFTNGKDYILKSKTAGLYDYIIISKSDGKLQKIIRSSKTKEKLYIDFTSENDIFARHVVIEHHNIDLKIELNYLQP